MAVCVTLFDNNVFWLSTGSSDSHQQCQPRTLPDLTHPKPHPQPVREQLRWAGFAPGNALASLDDRWRLWMGWLPFKQGTFTGHETSVTTTGSGADAGALFSWGSR